MAITILAALATPSWALDVDYWVSAEAGAASAFGGDVTEAVAEFGDSVGASAVAAPVLGAVIGAGAAVPLRGPLHAVAGLELRRLGHALWAPDAGATSWLALWAAGMRAGLRWDAGPWFAGAGGSALAPVSGIDQAASRGGSGIVVSYDVGAGRSFIPGAYLEAGLAPGRGKAVGAIIVDPVIGMSAGIWPGGIVDETEALQAQASVFVSLRLRGRKTR